MENNWVITVGRQFCSGGAEIGHKIAKALDIPYYDREIIDEAAGLLKMSPEDIRKHDEKPPKLWDYPGYQYANYWYSEDPSLMLPISIRIAEAQFSAISNYADKGPCVIMGRCADFVLSDRPNVISVFIKADLSQRIERACRLYHISEAEAKKLIKKTDKIRADYYDSHTQQVWGRPEYYDIIIDSGKFGTDLAARLICECVERRSHEKPNL